MKVQCWWRKATYSLHTDPLPMPNTITVVKLFWDTLLNVVHPGLWTVNKQAALIKSLFRTGGARILHTLHTLQLTPATKKPWSICTMRLGNNRWKLFSLLWESLNTIKSLLKWDAQFFWPYCESALTPHSQYWPSLLRAGECWRHKWLQMLVARLWFWRKMVLKDTLSSNLASSIIKTCCFICKTSRSSEQCLRFSTTMVQQKLCVLGNPKMTKAAFISLHLLWSINRLVYNIKIPKILTCGWNKNPGEGLKYFSFKASSGSVSFLFSTL